MPVLSFTVPHLTPPSGNHYKQPCQRPGRDGYLHLSFKLTKEAKAYYDAVTILARGQSLDPETPEERQRCLYLVQVDIYLGKRQHAGDKDNYQKTALDALQYARVIHNDKAVEQCKVNIHTNDRQNPRTIYHIQRLDMK
jgi:Holliday junction resolvase RusA-like endonuclease